MSPEQAAAVGEFLEQAEAAFRQTLAGFTCEEGFFDEDRLNGLSRLEICTLAGKLDAEVAYLRTCGHAVADDYMDTRMAWRDALDAALRRKRCRASETGEQEGDSGVVEGVHEDRYCS